MLLQWPFAQVPMIAEPGEHCLAPLAREYPAEPADGTRHGFMRNRVYDRATGRFTQEDPIGLAGGLGRDEISASEVRPYLWPGHKQCFDKCGYTLRTF